MENFDRPVEIIVARSGRVGSVGSARDALRHLFNGAWPDRSGVPFENAVGTCLRAVSGDVPAQAAREAFIVAARRAHVLAASDNSV